MNKILSIIIPTRNRQVYCIESINSILKELNDECELVIQDNSSDDSLRQEIQKIGDEKIIYNYNPKPLSFIDNFEEALNLSTAKYFCILGDDDSVTKFILEIVKWMDKNDIDSLSSTKVVDFVWPNKNIFKYNNGLLKVPEYNNSIKYVNVEENLKKLIENGFLAYQNFDLPRTYHGIIKKERMSEVKRVAGRYFGGLTPDIYSTVALSCVVKKHCILDFPFSIAGACPASATAQATVGGHSGKIDDAPHLKNRGAYHWEESVPEYYSVETIWAETAIKAIKDLDREALLVKFNNYRLYVYGIYVNRKYILKLSVLQTVKLSSKLGTYKINHIFRLLKSFGTITFETIIKKMFADKSVDVEVIQNIKSLEDAKEYTYKKLKKLNLE